MEGPGTLTFWWNVSSDDSDSYDYLELTVDGDSETELSGESGWEFYEVNLSAGTHTLRWTYHKDGDFTAGADAAWLDEVQFIPKLNDMTLHIVRFVGSNQSWFFAYPSSNYVQQIRLLRTDCLTWKHFNTQKGGTCQVRFPIPSNPHWRTHHGVGSWRLDDLHNRGHPSERQYKFNVTLTRLWSRFAGREFTLPLMANWGLPRITSSPGPVG